MTSPDPLRGRRIVRGLGLAGVAVGVVMLAAPRPAMRLVGLDGTGSATRLLAGLFAGRDLALGAGFLRLADDLEPDGRWLRLLAASQVSDILLALRLARRGDLGRPGLVAIVASALATFGAAVIADRDLRSG